jgi:hypothetical protein
MTCGADETGSGYCIGVWYYHTILTYGRVYV